MISHAIAASALLERSGAGRRMVIRLGRALRAPPSICRNCMTYRECFQENPESKNTHS